MPSEATLVDPATGQTEISIGAYLKKMVLHGEVAIRNSQGRHLSYEITKVVWISLQNGQFRTEAQSRCQGFMWHRKTGRSADKPTGQSRIVEPTPAIREAARSRFLLGVRPAQMDSPQGGAENDE